MQPFRRLAFVVNAEKTGASEFARELMAMARQAGVTKIRQTSKRHLPHGFFKGYDACCVVGGDGTLLGAACEATRENIPIIGVNQGGLGFLTTFSADEARAQFSALLNGEYRLASLYAAGLQDQPA